MAITETVASIVASDLAAMGVELVDVEQRGVAVRVVVDEPGGIALDRLAEVTRLVSRLLDEADPISSRYTLEVSSPGVERPLRTPRHFWAVIGQQVSFKWSDGGRAQRLAGQLLAADDDGIDVLVSTSGSGAAGGTEARRFPYHQLDRARTVFEWGPSPKPGKGSKPGAAKGTKNTKSDPHAKAPAAQGPIPSAPVATADSESFPVELNTAAEQMALPRHALLARPEDAPGGRRNGVTT